MKRLEHQWNFPCENNNLYASAALNPPTHAATPPPLHPASASLAFNLRFICSLKQREKDLFVWERRENINIHRVLSCSQSGVLFPPVLCVVSLRPPPPPPTPPRLIQASSLCPPLFSLCSFVRMPQDQSASTTRSLRQRLPPSVATWRDETSLYAQ